MSQIARYILLFILWFGGMAFFCLYHQKPVPAQPLEPTVIVKESKAQALVLENLQKKADELEKEINAQEATLTLLNSKADALDLGLAELAKKEKPKSASNQKKTATASTKSAPADSRPKDTAPNLFGGSSLPRQRSETTPMRIDQMQPVQRRPANANVVDSMTPAQVKQALNEAAERAKSCRGRGDLSMRLTIVNSGHINRISVMSGSLKGTPAEQCIISQFKQLRLPAFKNPASIDTTYTMRL